MRRKARGNGDRLIEVLTLGSLRVLESGNLRGRNVQTFVGMCAWHPFLEEAIDEIENSGIDSLVILPLFPQYSVTTTGSGFSILRKSGRPDFRCHPRLLCRAPHQDVDARHRAGHDGA